MLFKNYTKEISRPECNPGIQSVHCISHLAEDIREVLPYLNTGTWRFFVYKGASACDF